MADSTAFDEFLLAARDDLRRAYTGTTSAADIPTIVASALEYARTHAEVVARAANPVGYLYRAGHTKSDASTRGFVRWETDADATGVDPRVVTELSAMPRTQATAVWLVEACRWTNVQAAEGLEVSPAVAADHVSEGMARLLAVASRDGTEVERQLRTLAAHRLELTPLEASVAAVADVDANDDVARSSATSPLPAGAAPTEASVGLSQTDGDRSRSSWWRTGLVVPAVIIGLVIAAVVIVVARGDEAVDVPTVPISVGGMHDREVIAQPTWEQAISAEQPPSTFALARVASDEPIRVADIERARTEYLPASTYKLLHALIALDVGAVASIDTVIPWDGVTREIDAWNQDQTVASAIRESAVWAFQDIASRIGEGPMSAGVSAATYGNEDIGGELTSFWLDGDLRTTAIDQLEFLERLALASLPFDVTHQGQVLASLPRLDGPGTRIAYKTGTVLVGEGLAWLVGTVDANDGQWVFAYNTDFADSGDGPAPPTAQARLDAVVGLLSAAGVIAES